ncbi:hypothetical protein D9M68_815950 [compost metagenome]
MLEVVEQRQPFAQGFVGIAGAGNGEIQYRNGDLGANAALVYQFAGCFGKEVHVREAGDATLELLGDSQFGAVQDEVLVYPFGLGGPDMLLQPVAQRQLIGHAAEQAHGRMAMGIDQSRCQQSVGQLAHCQRLVLECFGTRCDQGDAAVADAQTVLVEHHARRLDRHQPGWK